MLRGVRLRVKERKLRETRCGEYVANGSMV